MSSNAPDPTEHEDHDDDVAEARHKVMEWLGNTAPIQTAYLLFVDLSPLALGMFVTSCLHGLQEESFSDLQRATALGEVNDHRTARMLLEGILGENEAVNEMAGMLWPDVEEADRGAYSIMALGQGAGPDVHQFAGWTRNAIPLNDLERIDWWKLAEDLSDEPPTWKQRTPDHDPHGCYDCLGKTCLIGLEDV